MLDYIQGHSEALAELNRYDQPSISMMTWMELMVGALKLPDRGANRRQFLRTFPMLPIGDAVTERAVHLRAQHRIKLPDAIIWATAQEAGCLLVTRNTKDFPSGDPMGRFPYRV